MIKLTDNERSILELWQDDEWWNTSDREIHYVKLHLKSRGLIYPKYTTKQLQANEKMGAGSIQAYRISKRGIKALKQTRQVWKSAA